MGRKIKFEHTLLTLVCFLVLNSISEVSAFHRYYCDFGKLHKACAYQALYASDVFQHLWTCCYVVETAQLTCSRDCRNGMSFKGRIYLYGTDSPVTRSTRPEVPSTSSSTTTPTPTTTTQYVWDYDYEPDNIVNHHEYFPSAYINTIGITAGSVIGALLLLFCVVGVLLSSRTRRLARSGEIDIERRNRVPQSSVNIASNEAAPAYESLQLNGGDTALHRSPLAPAAVPLTEPPSYYEVMGASEQG